MAADADGPEPHGTTQDFIFHRHKGQSCDRVDAFAQPVGGFGEAAGAEAVGAQRLNGPRIGGIFQPDLPGRKGRVHGRLR